jgi:hypothetical protein
MYALCILLVYTYLPTKVSFFGFMRLCMMGTSSFRPAISV